MKYHLRIPFIQRSLSGARSVKLSASIIIIMFTPNKGIQQNNAAIVRQVGATTGSKEMAKIM